MVRPLSASSPLLQMVYCLFSRTPTFPLFIGTLLLMTVCTGTMDVHARPPQKKAPQKTVAKKPAATNITKLPPGIIVFEPVPEAGISNETTDIASGWGDWLFLTVGGQPEIGQTPMLTSVSRAQREMNHTATLRLGSEDAIRVAKITGATHVAVGSVRSLPSNSLSLSYTIYDAKTGQNAGKPLTITGSVESIRKQLPALAAEMAHRLGVTSPKIPNQVEATTPELAVVGRTFWNSWTAALPAADLAALESAASHDPLSTICLLIRDRYAPTPRFKRNVTNLLTRLAPSNPLAWAYVGAVSPTAVKPFLPGFSPLRDKYPQNYMLSHTAAWLSRADNDWKSGRRYAERAIKDAPQNPDAWLALGQTLRQQASLLREGRFADDITDDEWKTLNAIYPVWERVVRQATEIDPRHDTAWQRVATAATFHGDMDLARKAFAKAEVLSKEKEDVYLWGFQMFDPKWGGTRDEMNAVAEKAITANYATAHDAVPVVKDLIRLGRLDEATTLGKRLLPQIDAEIKAAPDLNHVYADKMQLLEVLDPSGANREEILALSVEVVKKLPDDPWAHLNYAQRLSRDKQQYPVSEKEYRTVLRLDSENVEARTGLAFLLARSNSTEAETLLKEAIVLRPDDAYAHAQLGFLYNMVLRNKPEAIAEYKKAVEFGQQDILTLTRLSRMLVDGNKAAEAEPYALLAVRLYPKDVSAFNSLAYVFLMEGKLENATRAGQQAFVISDIDTEAHINFGLIQNARGDRREARREWERVVASKAGTEQKARAQGYLDKYPEVKP